MPPTQLTLIGKPDCHLCEDALAVVTGVMAELNADAAAPRLVLDERSILDDPELFDRYVEDIPVLMIDGKVHTYWRVDPARLRAVLLEENDSAPCRHVETRRDRRGGEGAADCAHSLGS